MSLKLIAAFLSKTPEITVLVQVFLHFGYLVKIKMMFSNKN